MQQDCECAFGERVSTSHVANGVVDRQRYLEQNLIHKYERLIQNNSSSLPRMRTNIMQ